MKKAKALFAAGIIVIVAGMSAALWYLNDSGKLHNENTTENYIDEFENVDDENVEDNVPVTSKTENDEELTDVHQTTDVAVKQFEEAEINEFLSAFAKVFFSEHAGGFDIEKCSDYDLIQFAYLHLRNTDKDSIKIEQRDDNIVYYHAVAYDRVKKVVEKYFGVQIPEESAYTENDYAFFSYSDGYFYTPAADGPAYENTVVADSVEYKNDSIVVRFDVVAKNEKYAEGEAKIRIRNNNMNLENYRVYK